MKQKDTKRLHEVLADLAMWAKCYIFVTVSYCRSTYLPMVGGKGQGKDLAAEFPEPEPLDLEIICFGETLNTKNTWENCWKIYASVCEEMGHKSC